MGTKTFRQLTTFRVGGRIKHFFDVKTRKEVVSAVAFAKKNKLPIFIIGGGSDILVSDNDYTGVVIRYGGENISFVGNSVTAEAGGSWDKLVEETVNKGLQGIECLSGIPGSVGGAPIQNIGAYGQELKDTFVGLTAYAIEKEKFVKFSKTDCEFGYRESFFKKPAGWQRFIITDVTLKLKKDALAAVKYDSLRNYLREKGIDNPTLIQVREAVLKIRETKFENPKDAPNAGSFFKNPIIGPKEFQRLKADNPEMPFFKNEDGTFKCFAAWFIEEAGWKGKKHKKAQVSPQHALVLINPDGRAKANDVLELSEKIIADVYKKFGVKLEREVQFINFDAGYSKIAILGYGIEGQDAEKYLKGKEYKVDILDKKFDERYLEGLEKKYDLIVRSPGVYRYLPEIVKAEKSGVKITSAIKIFFEGCPAKIIGVTGTKGKGTTATLIYEILKKEGLDVYLAGNIGKPYLELLSRLKKKSWVILEMSSFQLIDMEASPDIAVVLNITADHLDWHKDIKEYVEAKKNIVSHQKTSDFAVINEEYKVPKSFAKDTKAKVIFFSKKALEDKYKRDLLLRGEHNLENVAAAVSVAKILKISDEKILEVLANFKGLEHRLELVGEVGQVAFYNDSFATGPQPTIAAIKSFTEPETVILGGSDKGLDYRKLRQEIEKRDNVKNLILIGEIGDKIGGGIKNKNIINLGRKSMKEIVKKALEVTPKGGVILLSPATASFDMFANYKERGKKFKEAALALTK